MPLVKTGVVSQSLMGKANIFFPVHFSLKRIISALGGTAFIGWLCYKGMEGTDEDMYRNSHLGQRQRGLDNKSNYDPNTMLMETLKRGGAADLG